VVFFSALSFTKQFLTGHLSEVQTDEKSECVIPGLQDGHSNPVHTNFVCTFVCGLEFSWLSNTSGIFLGEVNAQRQTFRLLCVLLQQSEFSVVPTGNNLTELDLPHPIRY